MRFERLSAPRRGTLSLSSEAQEDAVKQVGVTLSLWALLTIMSQADRLKPAQPEPRIRGMDVNHVPSRDEGQPRASLREVLSRSHLLNTATL